MSEPGLTYDELKALDPCADRLRAVARMMGGAKKWDGHKVTARQAVEAGVGLDDLLWAASARALDDKDTERRLRLFMADCAARVLRIYERSYPSDTRPRDAIKASRDYARGRISDAAWAAARDVARPAAGDAAWVTAWIAARDAARAAAGDAAARAAWIAARDDAARAAEDAARDDEEKWQLDRLVAWLSDPEPKVLTLPKRPKA